nr:MAG: hypothetical protein [Chemarfal virus 277]
MEYFSEKEEGPPSTGPGLGSQEPVVTVLPPLHVSLANLMATLGPSFERAAPDSNSPPASGVPTTSCVPCTLNRDGKTWYFTIPNAPTQVTWRTCHSPGCTCKAIYGSRLGLASRCGKHRLDHEVRRDRKWAADDCDDCGATASYGYPGQPRRKCYLHLKPGMINLTVPKSALEAKYPGYIDIRRRTPKKPERKRKFSTSDALKSGLEPNPGWDPDRPPRSISPLFKVELCRRVLSNLLARALTLERRGSEAIRVCNELALALMYWESTLLRSTDQRELNHAANVVSRLHSSLRQVSDPLTLRALVGNRARL